MVVVFLWILLEERIVSPAECIYWLGIKLLAIKSVCYWCGALWLLLICWRNLFICFWSTFAADGDITLDDDRSIMFLACSQLFKVSFEMTWLFCCYTGPLLRLPARTVLPFNVMLLLLWCFWSLLLGSSLLANYCVPFGYLICILKERCDGIELTGGSSLNWFAWLSESSAFPKLLQTASCASY